MSVVVPKSSRCIIVVAVSVKEDDREGQGHSYTGLLYYSATSCLVNVTFCTSALSTSCLVVSAMDGGMDHGVCIKFCVKLGKSASGNLEMLCEALGEHTLSLIVVFE